MSMKKKASEVTATVKKAEQGDFGERLRDTSTGVRLGFTFMGTRKTFTPGQKLEIGQHFEADRTYIGASKKLFDTKHEAFRAVVSIRSQAREYWRQNTLPFPEDGLRLIRRDHLGLFEVTMKGFRDDLDAAVKELAKSYEEIKNAAKERLGELFNEDDYPASLDGKFSMEWDYPSVEPPPYLRELEPEVYRQQAKLVAARFNEAVALAEVEFTEQFADMVKALSDRLGVDDEGDRKVIKSSTVEKLQEFVERFRHLTTGSNPQLDALVNHAKSLVKDLEPKKLREDTTLRDKLKAALSPIVEKVEAMAEAANPRRRLKRDEEPVTA